MPRSKSVGIAARRAGVVDAGRAAGEDEAARLQLGDALGRQVVAHDLAEDVLLADAPGDELAVLRAEVEDQDAFTFGTCCHHRGTETQRRKKSVDESFDAVFEDGHAEVEKQTHANSC